MSSTLLINAAGRETRVALVENGHIAEFYLERKKDRGVVGNIYKGRVLRVLPGMQAAFVDIGLEKAAFLYVGDVVYDPDFARAQFELTEGEHEDADEVPELDVAAAATAPSGDDERASGTDASDSGAEADVGGAETESDREPGGRGRSRSRRLEADARGAEGRGPRRGAEDDASASSREGTAAGPARDIGAKGEAASRGSVGPRAHDTDAAKETAPSETAGGRDAAESEPAAGDRTPDDDVKGSAKRDERSAAGKEDRDADAKHVDATTDVGSRTERADATADDEVPTERADAKADDENWTERADAKADDEVRTERADATADDEVRTERADAKADDENPTERADAKADDEGCTERADARADDESTGDRAAARGDDEAGGEAGGEARGSLRRERSGRRRGRRGRAPRKEEEKEKAPAAKVSRKGAKIEDLLKVGQEVVVQISKDPIGTKGARITSHLSIPGRHLVFMPTVDHIGISRRISNEKERRRLREIVERMRPPGTGFIVRTVAENVPREKLETDIRFLIEVWNDVVRKNERQRKPGLLHPDLDIILRATRDLFAQDVEKLIIDDRDEFERVRDFVSRQDAALAERVKLHPGDEPIYEAYGIEQEINRALQRKVWLKSGGYLIIDQAEALTAIDVNSGRYVGKKSLEETITKINVEAAREIIYQLRLRNLGGIIICDFIDMENPSNRDKVFKTLQEALGRDKAKTTVLRVSELGLVEMTRKRVRESINRMVNEDCTYCDGKGYVKTAITVCYEIFQRIRRDASSFKDPVVVINCAPDVARVLQGEERQELRHMMDRYNKTIQVRAQSGYHRERFDIHTRAPSAREDLRGEKSPGNGDDGGRRNRDDNGRSGRGDANESARSPSGETTPG